MQAHVWLLKRVGFYSLKCNREPLSSFKYLSKMTRFTVLEDYSENAFETIQK
jgi:hypothetical protein